MKFLSKLEARNFLETKHITRDNLSVEEIAAVKEFFTDEELLDLSFDKIKIEDCFHHHDLDIKPQ